MIEYPTLEELYVPGPGPEDVGVWQHHRVGSPAADVLIAPIKWLWRDRLPLGMLTGFDGDPERGKSQHLAMMAAHITTGRKWPDGSDCLQGGVVLIGAEDSWGQVVVPRLMAAGADLARIRLLSTIPADDGEPRLLSIPEDIPILERLIHEMEALLIGFDPLSAFLSDKVNANSEHDVRRALTPLAEMLERTNCNSIALRHLSKNDKVGNALYRGLGSIGFNALARTALGVSKDPETPNTFIFSTIKNNLGPKPRSQRYSIEPVQITAEIEVSRICWGEETDQTPDELMTAFGKDRPRRDAKEMLLEMLADGPVESKLIFEAADSNQIAEKTLKRAKSDLGIIARKVGFQGTWEWLLPSSEDAQRGPHEEAPPKGATSSEQSNGFVFKTPKEGQRSLDNFVTPFGNELLSKGATSSKEGHSGGVFPRESERGFQKTCPRCGRSDWQLAGEDRECRQCGEVWTP